MRDTWQKTAGMEGNGSLAGPRISGGRRVLFPGDREGERRDRPLNKEKKIVRLGTRKSPSGHGPGQISGEGH